MILVITEKTSVVMTVSKVINARERRDGYLESNGYLVSWCIGRLVELAPPESYDKKYGTWRQEELPIVPLEWKYEVLKDTKKQYEVLKKLMDRSDVESIVCATDAGREGELIFRLVYQMTGCTKPFERLWISSMEDEAIREGFKQLRPSEMYDSLYQSALCRERADWIIGMNGTRFFSVLYGHTLNIGRVMTPTLAMIVMRDAAIRAFISEPFYIVRLDFGGFQAESVRIRDKIDAEQILSNCGREQNAEVMDMRTKETKEIGEYRGFGMELSFNLFYQEYEIVLHDQMRHRTTLGSDARGNITRLDNTLAAIPDNLEKAKVKLSNLESQRDSAKEEMKKPFREEEILKQKSARLAELDALLNMEGQTAPVEESISAENNSANIVCVAEPSEIKENGVRSSVLAELKEYGTYSKGSPSHPKPCMEVL